MRRRVTGAVIAVSLVLGTGPTVGDVGGCGRTAADLDESRFANGRKTMDCRRCTECGLDPPRCVRACDPSKPPDAFFPPTCHPLVHDGEVCLRALLAASCADYASYVDEIAPAVPSECTFCKLAENGATGTRAVPLVLGGRGGRMRARFLGLVLATWCAGCVVARPLLTDSGDLADYRAFRVAARQGTRLARAKRYLEAHPSGAWADEVRRTFESEEPLYFDAAKESRRKTSEYLANLPDGPHATAAIALLTAFDTHLDEIEMQATLREARRTEAMLDRASLERRLVGETILGAVGALLESTGSRFTEASPSLRRALGGPVPPTWGRVPVRREEDIYFSLPTRPVRESRLLTLTVEVELTEDEIAGGKVEAADLFIRWLEADRIVALDPTRAEDRTEAAVHAMDLLGGALEARFPAASCQVALAERELFARRCGGFSATVTLGRHVGDMDSIVIMGPRK